MEKKNKIIIIGLMIMVMILAIAGATYAFFTATVTDGDKGSSVIIQTGSLRLVYNDKEFINVSGMMPNDTYSKTVTVTNEGNVTVAYHLLWLELLNEFVTQSDLVMSISCTSSIDTCDGLSETQVSDSGSNIPLLYNVSIDGLEVHTYIVTIHFKETGSNQNDNQGKKLIGKIGIVEARDLAIDMYGYVYDENSSVMSNVIVELHSDPVSALTDSNGYYSIPDVPLGDHTAYIKTNDGSSTIMTTPISLKYGRTTNVNDTNISLSKTRKTIGVNITKTVSSSTLALVPKVSGTLPHYLSTPFDNDLITSITFEDEINIPPDAISSWDESADQNSTVMAYIKSDGVSGYSYYIQSEYKVFANQDMSHYFSNYPNLSVINNLQLLDTSRVTNMSSLFEYSRLLTSVDLSSFNTSNVTDMSYMFQDCTNLKKIDVSSFNTSKVTTMRHMFNSCKSITSLDVSNFDTSSVTNMYSMFRELNNLTTINFGNFDTSNVTTMYGMFKNDYNLTSLDLSMFEMATVSQTYEFFRGMIKLKHLDLSNWVFNSATNMDDLFGSGGSDSPANIETIILDNVDTSNVTNMSYMFDNLDHIHTLDLSDFDTSNVKNMQQMFYHSSNLSSINLSSFDTSKVTNMGSMFQDLPLTSLDLSNFDTSSVTEIGYMFRNTKNLSTLDFSSGVFTSASNYLYMFDNSNTNINIKVKDTPAQSFINSRLADAGITGTVTIG